LRASKSPQQTGRQILLFPNNQITNAAFDDPIAFLYTDQKRVIGRLDCHPRFIPSSPCNDNNFQLQRKWEKQAVRTDHHHE
jgi:hypothetical protein